MTHPATVLDLPLNSTTHRATPVPPTIVALLPTLMGPLSTPATGIPESPQNHLRLMHPSKWEVRPSY